MVRLAQIHRILESLGLSNYEAKAYSALLREYPITGYYLSKISGVPRSRIYESLEKLRTKGFVLVQEGRPATYIPITGRELISKTERSLFSKIDLLRDWFSTLTVKNRAEQGIWNIEGRENIFSKAEYMLHNAAKCLAICGWAEDLDELRSPLEQAAGRNVKIVIVSCGKFKLTHVENVFMHRWEVERKINVKDLTLVADRASVLVGSTTPEERCSAAWTESPGVVYVAREYILHEVVINRLLNYIPPGIKRELMAFYNQTLNL